MELVKGAPALRRAHLDQLVAALWPARASSRREFAQALAQRNALLARVRSGASPRSALATWDLELGRHALAVREGRARAVELVAPLAAPLARDIGLAGDFELRYRPRSDAQSPEGFAAELAERLDGDLERGFTGHGPHRDELVLARDGRELRVFGSQGEQRLALLALLVAEREALAAERDGTPLLLLDDVMSELDPGRRAALLERVTGEGQCVVTTADLEHVPVPSGAPVLTLAVEDAGVRVEEHA
jgi:DNA replication and repair protein RecF